MQNRFIFMLQIVRHALFSPENIFAKFRKAVTFFSCLESARKKRPVKLDDKQSERDTRELRIDKVGVRGLRFPIQVRDKARSVQNTIATIGMFVDLPKEFKGTRRSRREHRGYFAIAAKKAEPPPRRTSRSSSHIS